MKLLQFVGLAILFMITTAWLMSPSHQDTPTIPPVELSTPSVDSRWPRSESMCIIKNNPYHTESLTIGSVNLWRVSTFTGNYKPLVDVLDRNRSIDYKLVIDECGDSIIEVIPLGNHPTRYLSNYICNN